VWKKQLERDEEAQRAAEMSTALSAGGPPHPSLRVGWVRVRVGLGRVSSLCELSFGERYTASRLRSRVRSP
jgi:hypothetical protein